MGKKGKIMTHDANYPTGCLCTDCIDERNDLMQYAKIKADMMEYIRNAIGDAFCEISEEAFERLEKANYVMTDHEEDYAKAENWCAFLIREITTGWENSDIDPFI